KVSRLRARRTAADTPRAIPAPSAICFFVGTGRLFLSSLSGNRAAAARSLRGKRSITPNPLSPSREEGDPMHRAVAELRSGNNKLAVRSAFRRPFPDGEGVR